MRRYCHFILKVNGSGHKMYGILLKNSIRKKKNCERVFSTISQSSSYGDVINSDHCSMIDLHNLKKRDGLWLKLLISKGKFTVDAIKAINGNVSPVVLSCIDDSDDDDNDDDDDDDGKSASDVDSDGEDNNHYGDKDD